MTASGERVRFLPFSPSIRKIDLRESLVDLRDLEAIDFKEFFANHG